MRVPSTTPTPPAQIPIRAELTGDDCCTALGLSVTSTSPVIALCRALINAGHDPTTPLEVYRGDVLALRVRSIGEGAQLQITGSGVGFGLQRPHEPRTASPVPHPHPRRRARRDQRRRARSQERHTRVIITGLRTSGSAR